MRNYRFKEAVIQKSLAITATLSLLALLGIVLFLFLEGLPLFSHYSFIDFFSHGRYDKDLQCDKLPYED